MTLRVETTGLGRCTAVLLGLACLATALSAPAADDAAAAPLEAFGAAGTNETVITADRLNYDYRRSIAVFEGNVDVQDPRMRIRSEKLTVIFGEANSIKSVTAIDNVRIWQDDKKATCRLAVFRAATGEVVLTGDAVVERATDRLSGEQITFWIGEERIESVPGILRITPQRVNRGDTNEP